MSGRRVSLLSIAASIAVLVVLLSGSLVYGAKLPPGDQGGRPLYATLLGENEVPGPGDADGSGSAVVTLNQGQGVVCFHVQFTGIDPIRAAHIHGAPAGQSSGVVVDFHVSGLVSGEHQGCTENVDPVLIKDIRQNPHNYYVNVHNAAFPAGALRGQLSK